MKIEDWDTFLLNLLADTVPGYTSVRNVHKMIDKFIDLANKRLEEEKEKEKQGETK